MIPELGHYALILALCLSVVQVISPSIAKYTARGQCFFVGISFFALAYALLTNDFSVAYVAANSNSHLPAVYRFCALWGAHEGSLLLWVFILTGWMTAISYINRQLPSDITARVLIVLSLIAIGFYLFLLTTSSPFIRLFPTIPADGADLNPILQDPGLAVHPPILYMGYVGFAVPYAFAMAALWQGNLDPAWTRWARPWTLIAWCFLTLGIILGSAWAYRELGWGGWWFWDPVENASFLPWLAGTALIHSLAVTEKRQIFKAWTVLLAVCAFSLSLLGTFLVRSGILVSVHSFAADPQRGLFMLGFLLLVVGGSLALYAWRGRHLTVAGQFTLLSRETFLLANNILLFVAMLTVLLGTIYPLMMDVLHLSKLSVGAPYFNAIFIPIMFPVLLLMAVAPLFHWHDTQLAHLKIKWLIYLLITAVLALVLPWYLGFSLTFLIFFGLMLSFWVILWSLNHGFKWQKGSLVRRRTSVSHWGMILAHIGIAVTTIGIIATTAYSQQRDVSMRMGDSINVGPYVFELQTIRPLSGPNYQGWVGQVAVTLPNLTRKILFPEQRFYPVSQTATAKAAIQAGLFRDLYVALGTQLPDGAWSMRIYYKPFVRWIWGGGVIMVLGGLLAILDKRYRISREPVVL